MNRTRSARRRVLVAALPLTAALALGGGLPALAASVTTPTATAMNATSGGSAATRTVKLTGSGFEDADGDPTVQAVYAGGEAQTGLVVTSATTLTFVLGPAQNYQPGAAAISLGTGNGTVKTTLTFTRKALTGVDRELQYAFLHWNDGASSTAAKTYGYLPDNDCANFVSQSLTARGWKQSWQWYNDGPVNAKKPTANIDASATWLSSTTMSDWLATRPDLATHLGYRASNRDQVRVGDIVQFNYEGTSAWWDHSAIVSKIVLDAHGDQDIYYAAHTDNRTYGGSTQSLAAYYTAAVNSYKKTHPKVKNTTGIVGLRIQFWHL